VERAFAEAGYGVVSNAKNYRMRPDVPLLIPEVNPDHVALINEQDWEDGGFIATNPNCSTIGLVCALRPLVDAFGLDTVQVTTLQALSGAGYPGVSAMDALGNVIPHIGGEEDKLAREPRKLLGTLVDGRVVEADVTVSAQCTRVPVRDGHLSCVSVGLKEPAGLDAVRRAWTEFVSPLDDLDLPSQPDTFLHVDEAEDFPQPRRHVRRGGGMTVSVGRIQPCAVHDVKFVTLVHNTVRGAAGGAVLNAELLARRDYLTRRTSSAAAASLPADA
jgi:aspartate-semialdehyde dehydrogenase